MTLPVNMTKTLVRLSSPGGLLLQSLEHQYKASVLGAKATLGVYINSSVGIGEHPQILEEMDKQVQILADNQDKLEVLCKHYELEK